jgi:hypothetical protein
MKKTIFIKQTISIEVQLPAVFHCKGYVDYLITEDHAIRVSLYGIDIYRSDILPESTMYDMTLNELMTKNIQPSYDFQLFFEKFDKIKDMIRGQFIKDIKILKEAA